jgi:hypothetical protein
MTASREHRGVVRVPAGCGFDTIGIGLRIDIFAVRLREPRVMKQKNGTPNFSSVSRATLPTGRNGKHKSIVTKVLSDLETLGVGDALKIPLAQLSFGKAKVRSALNRAGHQSGHTIKTSSDEKFLYVWRE